jgi:8-oxo-dGTP pyrophosphatase MutT (NUDIX family)
VVLPSFNEAALREPLRARLRDRERRLAKAGAGMASAVLISLFERDADVHVWLLKRTDAMRKHSGQVAFPGGKRDPTDDSLLTTALRETEEELAICGDAVDVLGPLDDYVTGTGYIITPFVGWIASDIVPVPNPAEVARVFSGPLRRFAGNSRAILPRIGLTIEGEFVWGATLAIARGLGAIVRDLTSTRSGARPAQ